MTSAMPVQCSCIGAPASQRSWVVVFRIYFRNCLSCVLTARIFLPFKIITVSFIITHRVISGRSYWTKHITWYKIGRQLFNKYPTKSREIYRLILSQICLVVSSVKIRGYSATLSRMIILIFYTLITK